MYNGRFMSDASSSPPRAEIPGVLLLAQALWLVSETRVMLGVLADEADDEDVALPWNFRRVSEWVLPPLTEPSDWDDFFEFSQSMWLNKAQGLIAGWDWDEPIPPVVGAMDARQLAEALRRERYLVAALGEATDLEMPERVVRLMDATAAALEAALDRLVAEAGEELA